MFLLNSTGALLKNVKAGGVAKIRHLKTEPALRKGEKKAKSKWNSIAYLSVHLID